MLLKNHSLFLNPSEEESKRIEKIDSFDGITEDVFNKTLVDMFNGILCKKELKRISEDLQIVTIPDLNKVNDYVDHHNDYINVIKKKLQYILEIYDMDNIEMKANAIAEVFGSIANFIQISNLLDSDVFRNKLEEERTYIFTTACNPKTAKEIEKFNEIERIVKAKNTAIKNYNSVRITKELLVLAVLHKLEKKLKKIKKKAKAKDTNVKNGGIYLEAELKNTPETINLAKEILTTLNKESNKDSNKVFFIRKSNKEMTKEEKIEMLFSFLISLKPFDDSDVPRSEFASMFNNLIKFVKDSNTKKDSIVDIIEVNIDSMLKKFESVIDSFEFRQDLLNASQKINQKEALRKQRIYEIKSSEKTYDYVAEMTKFDTDMIKIEAHIQFKKYSQYILAKLKEARNLVKNIRASKPEKIVWDNISSPGITKNNREVSNETREKAFKGACDIFGITTDILPELFGGIKVINPAHNFFENPAVEMVLDNNGCFNSILMEHLEAQDKIETSKQTESEEITENKYKIDPNLVYGTFLIEMKNKKGIKLPKNILSTFAILVNNFIEKYKSYKTPDIVSEELIKLALKDIKEIINNGNYLFSDRYLNKLKAQEKLLVLKTEEIEFKTNKMNCTKGTQDFDAINIDLMKRDLNDLKEKLEYKHSCKNYYNYFTKLNMTLGNALNVLIHKNKAEETTPKFTNSTMKAKVTSDNFSTEKVEEKQKPIHETQLENLVSGVSKLLSQFQRDIRQLEYVEDDPIIMFNITERLEIIKQNSDTEFNNLVKELNSLKDEKYKNKKIVRLICITDDCVRYLSRLAADCPDMEEKLFNCNKYLNKLDFEEITNDFNSTTIPKIREDFMTQAEIQFNYQLNKSGVEYNRKVIIFYLDQALELNRIVRDL